MKKFIYSGFLILFFISLAALLASFNASAEQGANSIENLACTCAGLKGDIQESPKSFTFGKYKGQCIDSCQVRPALIIIDSPERNLVKLANIFSFGAFYEGEVRLSDLDKLEVGFEEFFPGLSHVYLKFNLKSDAHAVLLQHQSDPLLPPIKAKSFVLSSEGIPGKGHRYNLIDGLLGNFLIVHRLLTAEEFERRVAEYKHPTHLHTLKLSQSEIQKIFHFGVQQSQRSGLNEVYQLLTNNCSTAALGFVKSALGSKLPGNSNSFIDFEEPFPLMGPLGTLDSLKRRQLIEM